VQKKLSFRLEYITMQLPGCARTHSGSSQHFPHSFSSWCYWHLNLSTLGAWLLFLFSRDWCVCNVCKEHLVALLSFIIFILFQCFHVVGWTSEMTVSM